ncbi:MAG: GGDEF domain-containing protein [Sphingomonadaceae bacterium]|nr:GGDEF domain-containing protein [Sphingomonadaceae bacterium]
MVKLSCCPQDFVSIPPRTAPNNWPPHLEEDRAALLREVDALRGRIVELEQMADTDPMTALSNRRALDREMVRALATVDRHDMPYAFALLDVDALKRINDGHGHLAGDMVLRRLAIGLRDSFRRTDVAARLGGDEFALILPRVSLDEAQARLARFMADFSGRDIVSGSARLRVSVSAGLTEILPRDTMAQVISRADAALYQAKAAQRSAR